MKAVITAFLLFTGLAAAASEPLPDASASPTTYVQLLVAAVDEQDNSWQVADRQTGEIARADIGTLWFFGLAAQQTWGDVLEWGYEGGALVTRKEDDTNFRDSTGAVRAVLETRFYSVSAFMGGVVGVRPIPYLRLYAAAGPALTWAYVDEDDDGAAAPGSFDIDLSEGNNDVSLVPYARAGIEIVFPNDFALGVSVRYAEAEFDFDEGGEVEYDDTMLVVTLGGRI